jgi:hypothetical protein
MTLCSGERQLMAQLLLCPVSLVCFSAVALAAGDVQGVALNLSRGEPASGDEVALLRLDRGLREEARSKADPQGKFVFHVPSPKKLYLVRVIHQGVNYDQRVSGDEVVSIPVFDAAREVRGITGTIEILRTGTNGSLLHVSDMYEIENESRPPLTQARKRTFEVYLPPDARIDSVLAAGPDETVEMISATLLLDEPGHYAVDFALQPGTTKFAFNYDLRYDGHAAFRTRRAYPVEQFAVMIPLSMKFSSRSALFEVLPTADAGYQVYAANQLRAGEGPGFQIDGSGAPPPVGDRSPAHERSQSPDSSNAPVAGPEVPPLTRIDSSLKRVPTSSQSAVLRGVAAILLVVCVLLVWRLRKS